MSRIGHIFLTLSASTLLSGCVAALLPLAAVGGLAKNQIDRTKAKRELVASGAIDLARKSGSVTVGPGRSPAEPSPVAGKIFSGKGGAYGMAEVDLLKPQTIGCAGKPLAVAIDLDDMTGRDWTDAETLYRQNGLIEVLTSLRAAEISVIWLSDQPASASATISAILGDAGFSQPESDDFLFLDRGGEDRKQVRRWDAARNYCIVAMAGDDRADFDELYDYLRDPDGAITLEKMFDNGWFLTPPPLVEANEAPSPMPIEKEG